MPSASIDVELVYNRYLPAGDDLDRLQEALRIHMPEWSTGLRVYKGRGNQRPIEVGEPGALGAAVVNAAGERGLLYHELVAEHGPGYERLFGSAELRGASRELVVIVAIDEDPFARMGGALLMGNRISLQIRRARVMGKLAARWAETVFEDLCGRTSPAWGAVRSSEEYEAKVMSDGPTIAAVGRDFSRFLPGLFTANFFGAPYAELIGRDRLLTAPGARADIVDEGVLLIVGDDPGAWETAARQETEQRLLNHLGREHFFLKDHAWQKTRAPDWSS